jgi:hypothetical protein
VKREKKVFIFLTRRIVSKQKIKVRKHNEITKEKGEASSGVNSITEISSYQD